MTKLAIVGDTHLGGRGDSEHLLRHQLSWFSKFFEYCEENKVTHIIQEGDLHDRRKFSNFATVSACQTIFKRLEKYKTFVISGNHDCYFKSTNSVNSVSILLRGYDIKVVAELPETISVGLEKFDLYPWISPSNFSESLEFASRSSSDFALGHFEFANFEMHAGHIAESGLDHRKFSRYKRVYSGHYHTMSAKDNILYTGTPYELDWSDCGDKKGFWIHDSENPVHIENKSTLYEKIYYDEDKKNLSTGLGDKIVKIFVTNKKDQFKFDRYVDSIVQTSPYDLKVIDHTLFENTEAPVDNIETLSTSDIISSSVDTLENTSLDKSRLKTLLNELYTEAVQIRQE